MIWPTRAGIGLCVVRDILGHADISGQAKVQQTTFGQARQAGWAGISGGVRAISGICGPPSYRGIIRGWGGNLASPLRGLQHPTGAIPAPGSSYVHCLQVGRLPYKQCSAKKTSFKLSVLQCNIGWLPAFLNHL